MQEGKDSTQGGAAMPKYELLRGAKRTKRTKWILLAALGREAGRVNTPQSTITKSIDRVEWRGDESSIVTTQRPRLSNPRVVHERRGMEVRTTDKNATPRVLRLCSRWLGSVWGPRVGWESQAKRRAGLESENVKNERGKEGREEDKIEATVEGCKVCVWGRREEEKRCRSADEQHRG
jgi:hypothetical protein